MYKIRKSEEAIADYYFTQKIFSFVHFYVGQEAVAVGVCQNLEKTDRVFGNHRSHGHYLAKGGNLTAMYSEMLGKSNGCCKGKGGSMHMLDRSVGFMGSTPILASAVPIAAGSALNQKLANSPNITAVFFGDGASEEGIVYETINLAAVWQLPLLFVLEDNLYSVCTPHEDRKSKNYNLKQIIEGFGVKFLAANGNDFEDVNRNANAAIASIKSGNGPCVLYCRAFRHMAHSAPIRDDKAAYRKIDTLEARKEEDSVQRLREILIKEIGEVRVLKLESEINSEIGKSLEEAIASPQPETAEMYTNVYHD